MAITDRLFALQDLKFRDFHARLCPTLDPDTIIGVRTPALRTLVKELIRTGEGSALLKELPHRYYEENQLHVLMISEIKDFDLAVAEVDRFLPFVDNWATCDMLRPKVFRRNRDRLLPEIEKWIGSQQPYTIRFGIEMLMVHYLEENFSSVYLERAGGVRSDEYYVKMMQAWYFATALTKQYESTVAYLAENSLDPWVHNKTIQKARESFCISKERKEYLRTLRR